MEAVSNIQELIRIIATSSSSASSTKSIVVEIKARDNRIVRGVVRSSNYKGCKRPEVISIRTSKIDSNLLWSHVKVLLEGRKSFIVRNGQVDDGCLSEWTINDS